MILSLIFSLTMGVQAMDQVDEYIYRGPRPPSVQWLKDNGFREVIDLESGKYEQFHDDDYERERKTERTIDFTNLPWSDFWAPNRLQLKKVIYIMSLNRKMKIKTYVHCLHGEDRTGMAVAAYKIVVLGRTPDEAIADMYAHGFHRFPYFFWVKQLRNL
jgi:tyrosine-protein phosphatase SIW14